jgi:hypothetical protein
VLEALGDPHCRSVGMKVRSYGADVIAKRDAFQKDNDRVYYDRVMHTDENLPLAEPYVALQTKAFDLLQPIDSSLLLSFK